MPKFVLSIEDIKEIRQRRRAGDTLAILAKDFGVTAPSIYYYVKDIKVTKPTTRLKRVKEWEAEVGIASNAV